MFIPVICRCYYFTSTIIISWVTGAGAGMLTKNKAGGGIKSN